MNFVRSFATLRMTGCSESYSRFEGPFVILSFMRTYLRIFNPLVALLIFILCSFAAMKEDKDKPIVIGNVVAGGIPSYFFAKGMFCGVALILLGKILENQLGRDDRNL